MIKLYKGLKLITWKLFHDPEIVGNTAKGRISKRCFKKTKHVKFSEKRTFLTLWYAHVRPDTHTYVCVSGGKKCSFFGKFDMLCFLETPILIFVLLPYYRRNQSSIFYSHLCPFQNTPLEKDYFQRKRKESYATSDLYTPLPGFIITW